MNPTAASLLSLLVDGDLHGGPALAARLGVSRAAVWKLVAELRDSGVDVESLPRRGYRLARRCELLDASAISAAAGPLVADIDVHRELDSTNRWLYDAPAPPAGRPHIVFAEIQSAGRGRRGRSWLSPFGSGLTFSIAWTYAEVPAQLPALSLAVGVAVADTLRAHGAAESLKKYRDKPVIVCCESGMRSGAAARVLKAQGFAKVVNLRGGLAAWRTENLPLVKGK